LRRPQGNKEAVSEPSRVNMLTSWGEGRVAFPCSSRGCCRGARRALCAVCWQGKAKCVVAGWSRPGGVDGVVVALVGLGELRGWQSVVPRRAVLVTELPGRTACVLRRGARGGGINSSRWVYSAGVSGSGSSSGSAVACMPVCVCAVERSLANEALGGWVGS
jgi:hypothetical protein